MFFEKKQYQEALKEFEQASKSSHPMLAGRAALDAAYSMEAMGEKEKAIAAFQSASSSAAGAVASEALFNLGRMQF
jgi:tetratricopeptide (TPR) repeat protein